MYEAVKDEQNKNETTTLYTRKDKITYPVFFNLGFGLLGIFLGTIVDRFCTVIEELFHFGSRYNKQFCVLFKACFSGIGWLAVVVVILMVGLSIVLGRKTSLKYADLIYVLGGIGVGPLVIRLLNLNANSEVDVSRILEEKQMYPGYTLAWSYYFNHLKPAVDRLNDGIDNQRNRPYSSATRRDEVKLSLNKLLLLLPPSRDLVDINKLTKLDKTIMILRYDDNKNPYPFPVYCFTQHENKCYAMKCVKEPIVALRKMVQSSAIEFVTETTYEDELKRFYETLQNDILGNPHLDGYTKKGLVVPITVRPGESDRLRNGGLQNIIVNKLRPLNASDDGSLQSLNSQQHESERQPLLEDVENTRGAL